VKLLLAFVVPTMVLFSVFAFVAHEVAKRDLEAELGTRLEAVAASAALQIRGRYLADMGAPEDDDDRAFLAESRAYQNTLRKLDALVESTGVARIYIFDRDFLSLADTDSERPLGSELHLSRVDTSEVMSVFDDGASASPGMFQGADGRRYKSGYAPVFASETDQRIVLALGVDAPAAYFDRLADLRNSLFLYGAGLALFVLAIAVVVATLITRPVRSLAAAAERIGAGDLDAPVARTSRDEIGFLAETMDEMRSDLRARDEHLQLMLAGIAHEVRNPLGGIELFTGILRDEIPADDERRKHVDRIGKELTYLDRVVNEFLDYARRAPLELGDVDLANVVGEVIELERADARDAGVELIVEVGGAALCRGDSGQLRRAVLNLVRNAVQAGTSADPPVVRVVLRRAGEANELSVENHGTPIPDDVRERMFEPFFTTRERGTGLGLAFVREIIAAHGGTIEVDSDERATRFLISIPCSTTTEAIDGRDPGNR
jgi:signal transduction histidine kinase